MTSNKPYKYYGDCKLDQQTSISWSGNRYKLWWHKDKVVRELEPPQSHTTIHSI